MRYLIVILSFFGVLVFGCQENSSEKVTEEKKILQFFKRHFNIDINSSIYGTAMCNNQFVTLKTDGEFVCINSVTFEIDTATTSKLNIKNCSSFYQVYDSLIVVENGVDYFINSEFEYIPYNKFKNSYYKSDTTFEYDYHQKFIDPLYSDSNYVIAQFCHGEFGGTLYFFDKKNAKTYCCPATCATIVNKIDHKYVVTNSIAHGSGSSEVLEISNPKSMIEINFDTVKHHTNFWYPSYWNGMSEKRYDSLINLSRGGNKKILDAYGVLIHSSFNHENKIYHIYSVEGNYLDNDPRNCNIYIGQIENNKIEAIDSICNIDLFTYTPRNRVYEDWTLYSFNFRRKNTGFIAVKNDTINIVNFEPRDK